MMNYIDNIDMYNAIYENLKETGLEAIKYELIILTRDTIKDYKNTLYMILENLKLLNQIYHLLKDDEKLYLKLNNQTPEDIGGEIKKLIKEVKKIIKL